jgi:hypothetical protein
LPPLEEVPEGTHYCLDCNEKGTTACLQEYFNNHHDERANFESSRDFVLQTLQERLVLDDDSEATGRGTEGGDEEHSVATAKNGRSSMRIPQSELSRASKLHHDAASFSSRFIQLKNVSPRAIKESKQSTNNNSKSQKQSSLQPAFFVGKCVRLYCPVDNQYHSGRIVDWRIATHSTSFWESEVANVEYFVRFLAGKDHRKVTSHQWLVLEEHALAVSSTLIWGMNVARRGVLGWNPGSTWLRTSLELIPIQAYLEHGLHQVYYYDASNDGDASLLGNDVVKPEHKSWSLASFYGEEQHEFLDLKDESVDYFSSAFGEARYQRTVLAANKPGSELDSRVEVAMGLAHVEWEEQERVKAWQRMPLQNPRHPRALTLGDEAALKPCLLLDRERHPSLCPSLQIDFDRAYLLSTMIEKDQPVTKEVAASLVCELVAPSPRMMQQLKMQET